LISRTGGDYDQVHDPVALLSKREPMDERLDGFQFKAEHNIEKIISDLTRNIWT
jgi:hypothetical protein